MRCIARASNTHTRSPETDAAIDPRLLHAGQSASTRGYSLQPTRSPTMKPPLRAATIDDVPTIVAMRDRLNALELANCPHASIEPLTVAQFAERWGPTFGHADYHWQIV